MTLKALIGDRVRGEQHDHIFDQLLSIIKGYPELGDMNAWAFLANALRLVDCPACIGHDVAPTGCKYCEGRGLAYWMLLTHPMNLRHPIRHPDAAAS